jgi:hypothetical protein
MNKLELSNNSFKMHGINLACPTSADDMVVVSLTKLGLDNLIDICYQNSIQERYHYNATKSNVVVFNETKQTSPRNGRKWHIGFNPIEESDSYTHLGVLCSKDMNLNENISNACSKLRKTFFSLADCGVHKTGLHPITSRHLYKTIVLSKALFGCELWCNINDSQILKLERVHRQCLKFMQSMPQSTRTDVALSCIGIFPVENEIDKRKLLFFGQLCQLDTNKKAKIVFVTRLIKFMNSPRKQRGFIPDIYRIFGKYHLTSFLIDYVHSASFPSISCWKNIIKKHISTQVDFEYHNKSISDNCIREFISIHNEFIPCSIWRFCEIYRDYLTYCRTVVVIMSKLFSRDYDTICIKCKMSTNAIAEHLVLFCLRNDSLRQNMWKNLHKYVGDELYEQLCNLSPRNQLIEIISGLISFELDDITRVNCFKMIIRFIHYMCKTLMFQIDRREQLLI